MLHHRQVQLGTELQSCPHDVVVEDGFAVIGHSHRASPLQCSKVSKRSAARAAGCRGNREHVDHSAALRLPQPCDPLSCIHDRRGVWHGAD
jgi:hypothetical protein